MRSLATCRQAFIRLSTAPSIRRHLRTLFPGLFPSSVDSIETGFTQLILDAKVTVFNICLILKQLPRNNFHSKNVNWRTSSQSVSTKAITMMSAYINSLEHIIGALLPLGLQQMSYEPTTEFFERPRQSGLQLLLTPNTYSALLLHGTNRTSLQQVDDDVRPSRPLQTVLASKVPTPEFKIAPREQSPSFKRNVPESKVPPDEPNTDSPVSIVNHNQMIVIPDSHKPQISSTISSSPLKLPLGGLADRLQITSQYTSSVQRSRSHPRRPLALIPTPIVSPACKTKHDPAKKLPRWITASMPHPRPTHVLIPLQSQPKKQKRKRRETPRLSCWEYNYKRLNSLITPVDEHHRNHHIYRTIWLNFYSRNQKYQFRTPVRRRFLQHHRWKYIFSLRKKLSQQTHVAKKKWQIQRKRNQRLYKLAYLQFKKGRVELLKVIGKLGKAYKMGWTADREWQGWKRLLYKERRRRKWTCRKRKVRNYAIDDIQRRAERRMLDMYSSNEVGGR